jgi:hypothetical protein
VRRHRSGTPEIAEDFGLELDSKVVIGDVGERRRWGSSAWPGGRVHEDVDPAQFAYDLFDETAFGDVVGRMCRDCQHSMTGAGDVVRGLTQHRLIARHERDIGPFRGELVRDCQSDAAAAPGHDRAFAGQLEIHTAPSLDLDPGTPERRGDMGAGPEVSPFDRPGGDEGNCRPTGRGVVEDASVDQKVRGSPRSDPAPGLSAGSPTDATSLLGPHRPQV